MTVIGISTLLIGALAVWEIVEIWHHSQLFAGRRAYLEARGGRLSDMLLCPFCLSVWVGILVAHLLTADIWLAGAVPAWLLRYLKVPLYGLAAARLSNLLNDVSHKWCRTPKQEIEFNLTPIEDEGDTNGSEADSNV